MRAWIEIASRANSRTMSPAALLVRAWIEISDIMDNLLHDKAALLVRAWIEISKTKPVTRLLSGRSPRESVD